MSLDTATADNLPTDKSSNDFAVPSIPFKKPTTESDKKSTDQPSIEPDHQTTPVSEPVKSLPDPLTTLQPNEENFYIEIIKDGTVVSRHFLNKNRIIIGRATDCDLVFEHCSISRYHAGLYWKENNQNVDDDGFFYLSDLNSSHGTIHNKSRLEENKFQKLVPHRSFIKLGASSRLLLFGCVNSQDEQNQDQPSNYVETSSSAGDDSERMHDDQQCTWGMDIDYADATRRNIHSAASSGLQTVLNIINENTVIDKTDNENAYSVNPQKAIQNWFEFEGYEYEYTIAHELNKFKCTLEFPIEDQHVPISGDEEIRKKDAINSACLRACRILDKANLLFAWQKSSRFEKRKQDSDEDDSLIDETGERESKRARLEALKNKKVENLDTLNKRFQELRTQIDELQIELDKTDQEMAMSKGTHRGKDDEELDSFMKTIATVNKYSINDLKIRKSKSRMKMSQLIKEKEKIERLIKIAQPNTGSYKVHKDNSKSTNKVNELLEKAKAKLHEKMLDAKIDENLIEKTVTQSSEIESNVESTQVTNASSAGFAFNKLSTKSLLKPSSFSLLEDDESEKKEKLKLTLLDLSHADHVTGDAKPELTTKSTRICVDNKTSISESKKKSKPLINKKMLRRDEDESKEDDKFVDWVPPDDEKRAEFSLQQTGDGRSKLNEKYGY